MKKLAFAAASLVLAPALFSTAAFADSPGRLAIGDSLYQVRNVTQNAPKETYASSVSATCGDTVKFSVEISNTQFGLLKDVTVKAPINGTITVSATNVGGETVSSTGKATASTDKGSFSYIAGSAVLRASDGSTIKALNDSVVTSGVNTGELKGSTQEFVQYQAKVECPTTPVTPTTPEKPATPALPSTGAGDMILPALGLAGISAAAVYAVNARRARA